MSDLENFRVEARDWLDKNIIILSQLKKYEKSELTVKKLIENINIIDKNCQKIL